MAWSPGRDMLGAGRGVADDAASSLPVRIAAAISTVEGLKVWLAEQYAARTPVRILYILKTPIEAPLSEEEIAAYNALRTYRGN